VIVTRTGQRSLRRRPDSDDWRLRRGIPALAIGGLLAVSLTSVFSALHGFLDLKVYRLGARTWMHHGALYGPMPPVAPGKSFPFTYPPSAALLMTPLAVVPLWLAELLVTATSLGCLGVTVWVVLSRVRPDVGPAVKVWLATAAVVVLVATEPVRLTLWFGQVNLVLMAAVVLDCLTVKPRWPRGLLIGVAAVTKLTPAAFVLFFLVRKDWKAAGTAAVTAAAVVLSGFVLFPRESRQYWFHTIADTNRIGLPDYVGNQSIKGMLARLGLAPSTSTAVWLGLSLAVACIGAVLMHRLLVRAEASAWVAAMLVNAVVVLLASPVSWTHHWVWVGPALVAAVAWAAARPSALRLAAVTAFATVFLIGPGLVPNGAHRELAWSWWQYIPGDMYIIAAVALFAVALVRLPR
jgi:alpha-1,2-mannosyltransferase